MGNSYWCPISKTKEIKENKNSLFESNNRTVIKHPVWFNTGM